MRFVIDRQRMLPHQRAFWELPNFLKLLVGGYGWKLFPVELLDREYGRQPEHWRA